MFFCVKSGFEISFKPIEMWYIFLDFAFVYINNFASKIIKSKVSSYLKLLSCPKSTMLSFSVTDVAFAHLSLTAIWNCSQNGLILLHLKKDMSDTISLFFFSFLFKNSFFKFYRISDQNHLGHPHARNQHWLLKSCVPV